MELKAWELQKAQKENNPFSATFTERLSMYWFCHIQRKCIELPLEKNPRKDSGNISTWNSPHGVDVCEN
jgi:hypothetical protein